jgi:uncharacterized membrane protein
MIKRRVSARQRVVLGLVGMTIVSLGLYLGGVIQNHSSEFSYMAWNLFLAWLPLLLAAGIVRSLRKNLWSSWKPLTLTILWLVLLPNSFYMISDFIHIQEVQRHDLLYDIVMFTSFIFTAALIGFVSLYLVHLELAKRLRARQANVLVGTIVLLCSFAIYLGRDLRWNSWDVLVNPAGILFDISDRIIHPFAYGSMFTTTISFFVLISSMYIVGWQIGYASRPNGAKEGRG